MNIFRLFDNSDHCEYQLLHIAIPMSLLHHRSDVASFKNPNIATSFYLPVCYFSVSILIVNYTSIVNYNFLWP